MPKIKNQGGHLKWTIPPNPEIEKLKPRMKHNEAKLRYHKNELKALSTRNASLTAKPWNHASLPGRNAGSVSTCGLCC
jgi:hypothetical protein